jgi:hypothetical protein
MPVTWAAHSRSSGGPIGLLDDLTDGVGALASDRTIGIIGWSHFAMTASYTSRPCRVGANHEIVITDSWALKNRGGPKSPSAQFRRKLSLLGLAADLGNVSRACKLMGYSRQQFYEIRRNLWGRRADRPPARNRPGIQTSVVIRNSLKYVSSQSEPPGAFRSHFAEMFRSRPRVLAGIDAKGATPKNGSMSLGPSTRSVRRKPAGAPAGRTSFAHRRARAGDGP